MRKLDLRLNATVYCGFPQDKGLSDSCCGRLAALVADPRQHRVCMLVVEYGLLRKQSRVVPLSALSTTENGDIHLRITRRIWDLMPEHHGQARETSIADKNVEPVDNNATSGSYLWVPPDTGIPAHAVLIDGSTPVESLNDTLGHLAHVAVDARSGKISQIVLERGIFPTFYAIPGQYVEEIQSDYILISLTNGELNRLSQAGNQTDEELESAVRSALLEEGAVGFASIDPVAQVGKIILRGTVPSMVCKLHAEELVRLVIGVKEVCNQLRIERHADSSAQPKFPIQSARSRIDANMVVVSAALASDPRTRDAIIDVIDDRGIVILQGNVSDFETRKAAESITAGISGVTSVINELLVAA